MHISEVELYRREKDHAMRNGYMPAQRDAQIPAKNNVARAAQNMPHGENRPADRAQNEFIALGKALASKI